MSAKSENVRTAGVQKNEGSAAALDQTKSREALAHQAGKNTEPTHKDCIQQQATANVHIQIAD